MATVKNTSKKSTTKTKKTTRDAIVSAYMDYVLMTETYPKSVYKFCKEHKFEEQEFYEDFASFKNLETSIWSDFYSLTITLLHKSEDYQQYANREKLLTFYYTFFEMLTANRSYVLMVLSKYEMPLKNLEQLKQLRQDVKEFAKGLISDANEGKKIKALQKNEMVFSEATWVQVLFLMKFWKEDNSPGFEKTDMAIEKSVNTVFDVFDNTPLESIIDLGKFLWQNKPA
ncbi:TetR family transcriptional regulator C-terminal domain-containing protein [Croceibacter atlanticus]|uniref:TetR family transcriptional regulator C-terminal domain-containing protein n=1 Tax=Croceibacter atlanticus TaxID=313588 RepID=UPI0023520A3D|nr:TetR family transcriptional regulator C-terminal domain-containing protein [Croceibacter atlanticus]|tara:strand:+ start:22662 stop:23345 length:684 start_codon:yes stop_codon:yes gene_type:complete